MFAPGFSKKISKKKSVRIEKVVNVFDAFLISVPNFMTKEESKSWLKFADSVEFEDVDVCSTKHNARRYHQRFQFDDEVTASKIFEKVLEFIPSSIDGLYPIACCKNIRLYRYSESNLFGPHIDDSNVAENGTTKLTLLIYLNSSSPGIVSSEESISAGVPSQGKGKGKGKRKTEKEQEISSLTSSFSCSNPYFLVGGETVFYSNHKARLNDVYAVIQPERGLLLLHGHGDRCKTHESRIVRRGIKYVLRTDVVYGESLERDSGVIEEQKS